MPQNLMCKTQKAGSQNFRDNFDRIFNHIHPKNIYGKITIKKENLPGNVLEYFYPEEIRAREIERKSRKEGRYNG